MGLATRFLQPPPPSLPLCNPFLQHHHRLTRASNTKTTASVANQHCLLPALPRSLQRLDAYPDGEAAMHAYQEVFAVITRRRKRLRRVEAMKGDTFLSTMGPSKWRLSIAGQQSDPFLFFSWSVKEEQG
ncbi:unnamed protein product [Arctogadus glacialis]